jgi:drug/metabolite transporter (DMT)-like permease
LAYLSLGLLLTLLATIIMVFLGCLFKFLFILNPALSIFEIQFFKAFIEIIILMAYTVFWEKRNYFKELFDKEMTSDNDRKYIQYVAMYGGVSNYLLIISLMYISLVLCSLLNNLFPVFVIIVAAFMIREVLKVSQLTLIGVSFVGVIVMSYSTVNLKKNISGSY